MFGGDLKRLDDELKELNTQATKFGQDYSRLVYPARVYVDVVKHYLAARISELREENSKLSEAKLENLARADKVYKDNLERVIQKNIESEAARIKYESAVREVESCRTRISLYKSEIERFGG